MTALLEDGIVRSAVLSGCRTYRYALSRVWDAEAPTVAWVMLNPSTADHERDDNTIRKCIGFSRRWGYGGLVVVNLFGVRCTDPAEMASYVDPVGPGNDRAIADLTRGRTTIAAWGASVPRYWRQRPAAVLAELRRQDVALFHLGLTKAGQPRHPLYLANATEPVRWV